MCWTQGWRIMYLLFNNPMNRHQTGKLGLENMTRVPSWEVFIFKMFLVSCVSFPDNVVFPDKWFKMYIMFFFFLDNACIIYYILVFLNIELTQGSQNTFEPQGPLRGVWRPLLWTCYTDRRSADQRLTPVLPWASLPCKSLHCWFGFCHLPFSHQWSAGVTPRTGWCLPFCHVQWIT